jgi:hypothetical protein
VWDAAELSRLAAGGWGGLAAAAGAMTAVALDAGGHDNITVVLGAYPPVPAPDRSGETTTQITGLGGADAHRVDPQHEGSEL